MIGTAIDKIVKSVCYIFKSMFIKRNPKWWALGSWIGNAYTDNSKYLLETAIREIQDPEYRFYWVGNEKVRQFLPDDNRVIFLQLNSKESIPILLRCKYFFSTQFPSADICGYNIFHGGKIIFLDHGIPIKKIGAAVVGTKRKKPVDVGRLTGATRKFDYKIVSSPLHAEAEVCGYNYMGITLTNSLRVGSPRNDYLLNCNNAEEIQRVKLKYSELFKFDPSKKVILYLPTFRRKIENTPTLFFDDYNEHKRQLKSILTRYNAVLIEKSHNRLVRRDVHAKQDDILREDELVFISSMVDTQELLMMSDMMISDYSGCVLDYLLLDRPMINYVIDYEEYKNHDAGLFYELEDFAAGPTPRYFDQLLSDMEDFFKGKDQYREKRARNRERFLTYEHGKAGKNICQICMGNQSFDEYRVTRNPKHTK